MTMHRQVNVHHKHISVTSNFSAKLCEKLTDLIFLVLDTVIFYKKHFLVGRESLPNDIYHKRTCFSSKLLALLFFPLKLHLPSLILIMKFSVNLPVTTKNICAGGSPAHHFEQFRLNLNISKFHGNMTRRHG